LRRHGVTGAILEGSTLRIIDAALSGLGTPLVAGVDAERDNAEQKDGADDHGDDAG
jgi:hypothetical protein